MQSQTMLTIVELRELDRAPIGRFGVLACATLHGITVTDDEAPVETKGNRSFRPKP